MTEVCHLVGYTSLGSFSSRFRELVGVTPSAYQAEFAAIGAPRIPGCFVLMHGLSDRRTGTTAASDATMTTGSTPPDGPAVDTAIAEKPGVGRLP